jgi:hypothetical protein
MRRKPSSASAARIDADTRRRECRGRSRPPGNFQSKTHGSPEAPKSGLPRPIVPEAVKVDGPQIVDDFPEVLPVTQGELDVIETYLGMGLDEILRRME